MPNRVVAVEDSRIFDAPPERVWSLLSGPELWSLRRPDFAFDVAPADIGRLRVVISSGRDGPSCALWQVSEEIAGQVMSVSALPWGRVRLTLTAEPSGDGTRAGIAVAAADPAVPDRARAYWQTRLNTWLTRAGAVLAGSRMWPGPDMDPALNVACRPATRLRRPATKASVSILVNAPAARVWDVVHSPQSQVLGDPGRYVCAGQVPGTPTGQPGEMQYFILRDDQGHLGCAATVVTEVTAPHRALTSVISPKRQETLHEITPGMHGTQVTLTTRWPRKYNQTYLKHEAASGLDVILNRYKDLAENPLCSRPT